MLPRTAIIIAALFGAVAASAVPDEAVFGRWASAGTVIEIGARDGRLSARVVALKDPNYLEGEEFGPPGVPRRDDRNPQAQLRDRPLLGMELLSDYTFDDGEWQGKIYDPESGKTYSSKMWVEDGALQMRGYIGISLVGRTATFIPVSTCEPHMVAMLATAGLGGC